MTKATKLKTPKPSEDKTSHLRIGHDADKTQGRLAMIAALKATLKSAFAMLGIDAPEHMASLPKDPELVDEEE